MRSTRTYPCFENSRRKTVFCAISSSLTTVLELETRTRLLISGLHIRNSSGVLRCTLMYSHSAIFKDRDDTPVASTLLQTVYVLQVDRKSQVCPDTEHGPIDGGCSITSLTIHAASTRVSKARMVVQGAHPRHAEEPSRGPRPRSYAVSSKSAVRPPWRRASQCPPPRTSTVKEQDRRYPGQIQEHSDIRNVL